MDFTTGRTSTRKFASSVRKPRAKWDRRCVRARVRVRARFCEGIPVTNTLPLPTANEPKSLLPTGKTKPFSDRTLGQPIPTMKFCARTATLPDQRTASLYDRRRGQICGDLCESDSGIAQRQINRRASGQISAAGPTDVGGRSRCWPMPKRAKSREREGTMYHKRTEREQAERKTPRGHAAMRAARGLM